MADRLPAKLANESALGVYRFTWTSADGTRMEVQWGEGMGNPLMFRRDTAREIARPERFGWKTPRNAAGFKRFAQAVADEFESGYDDDELEGLQPGRERAEPLEGTPASPREDPAAGRPSFMPSGPQEHDGSTARLSGWAAAHPLAAGIGRFLDDAADSEQVAALAGGRTAAQFTGPFWQWAESRVALTPPGPDGAPDPFTAACVLDPSFAATVTAAAARRAYQRWSRPEHRGLKPVPGDWFDDEAVRRAAAAAGRTLDGPAPAVPPGRNGYLMKAAEIDICLARAGVPPARHGITSAPHGSYAVSLTGDDGTQHRLAVPGFSGLRYTFGDDTPLEGAVHGTTPAAETARLLLARAAPSFLPSPGPPAGPEPGREPAPGRPDGSRRRHVPAKGTPPTRRNSAGPGGAR